MSEAHNRSARTTRAINLEIAGAARTLELEAVELLCECGRGHCVERVAVPLADFDGADEADGYFVNDDHLQPGDEVIARVDGYVLVLPGD
jgi:hypothetical protein